VSGVRAALCGYASAMSAPDDHAAGRAEPLPEEVAAGDDGDRRDEAAEILRDSEERVAAAATGVAPGDAAEENRRSDEGV
jgi:hypothetical protein